MVQNLPRIPTSLASVMICNAIEKQCIFRESVIRTRDTPSVRALSAVRMQIDRAQWEVVEIVTFAAVMTILLI